MTAEEELLALCARATQGEWEHSGECSVREKASGHLIATTVNSDDIVQAGELPVGWGLLTPGGGKKDGALVVRVEAKKLKSKPLDRPMLASILRRVTENMVPADSLAELARAKAERIVEERMRGFDGERERTVLAGEVKALEDRIADFEKRSGVRIDYWSSDIAEAVRIVAQSREPLIALDRAVDRAQSMIRSATKRLEELKRDLATVLRGKLADPGGEGGSVT